MERRPSHTWLVFAASCGFLAGMLVMAALFAIFPDQTRPALANSNPLGASAKPSSPPAVAEATAGKPALEPSESAVPAPEQVKVRPTPPSEPPGASAPEEPEVVTHSVGVDPIQDLRSRHLELPVKGAVPEDVHDMFNEMRGFSRRHEAVDMLAPRNTPVVAVEGGTIARLFFSKAGGITIYQFDPTNTYVYYYAHLERYADGLKEGDKVKRGQLIGFVGTTGNAPRDTPHLHFAIFKMTDEKRWWEGTAIDPFQVLR